ncbi:Doxorubicin resistance ATP-binding protein DrrA [Allorhodopirellula heiligendammensis]|uniref:Doxorubicin resistance ATP-binding protein DrrA n=1 Tax=Allorhodopirellula heiligendammensis TaxID=2714739 RepID=A0A5C6C3E5_9BACT|nr:Doxorubicin resistance ATP-binding protein DrrA [Allorhodopirellula heiligendammensis]
MISTPPPAISVKDLRKSYPQPGAGWGFGGGAVKQHVALDGITFELQQGERLAYLGPNGAGKTTMIRCLSGRAQADSGTIDMLGQRVQRTSPRDMLGLVPQEIALYADLTTRENLFAFGRFHGLRGSTLKRQVDWALKWTGLADRGDELVATFSGGMKRRINLACGVLHEPEVLLLDEPSVGVDPQSRERIFLMLDQLSERGTSILLTTHHLDEAETQCDRIVIADHGRVVAAGTFDELLRQTIGVDRVVRIQLEQPLRGHGNEPLATSGVRLSATPGESHVTAKVSEIAVGLPRLIEAVGAARYTVADVEVHSPTLHHVFLHLTGRELRD